MRAGRPWKATRSRARRIQRQSASSCAEHLEREVVGRVDVGRISGERGPAERTLALAEERTDVLGHEPGDVERVVDARRAPPGRGCCCRSRRRWRRCAGSASIARTCSAIAAIERARCTPRGSRAAALGFAERHAVRHVAVQRIVRRGLVGDDVGRDAAARELREDVGGVTLERDRTRGHALRQPALDAVERVVEVVGRARRRSLSPAGARFVAGRPRPRARRRRSS